MSTLTERITIVEEIAHNLADALLDPQVKDVAARHEKRVSLHKALISAIDSLVSMAYCADAYVELLSMSTKTEKEESPDNEGFAEVRARADGPSLGTAKVSYPPDTLARLNASLSQT